MNSGCRSGDSNYLSEKQSNMALHVYVMDSNYPSVIFLHAGLRYTEIYIFNNNLTIACVALMLLIRRCTAVLLR